MTKIISTTQVQKKIGEISKTITEKTYIVTNNGEGRIVMLPYFEGSFDLISDYMEEYQMRGNKENLQKRYKQSLKSGKSSLKI